MYQDITTLITSVGFPIACCVAMGWYYVTSMKKFEETLAENTKVLEKLLTKLQLDNEEQYFY